MLSIGDLARHARVSVRMLRHYDELGLVKSQRVAASTGYRWYSASQVGRVNQLAALKSLGVTLQQCRVILDVAAAIEVDDDFGEVTGIDIVDLPAETEGASVTHRGSAAEVANAWLTMDTALEQYGLASYGTHR